MTDDIGQIPEGGQPELRQHPGGPAPAVFPFPDRFPDREGELVDGVDDGEEELLMPGSGGAWGDAVLAPPQPAPPASPLEPPPAGDIATPLTSSHPAPAPAQGPATIGPEYLDVGPPAPAASQVHPLPAAVPAQPGAWDPALTPGTEPAPGAWHATPVPDRFTPADDPTVEQGAPGGAVAAEAGGTPAPGAEGPAPVSERAAGPSDDPAPAGEPAAPSQEGLAPGLDPVSGDPSGAVPGPAAAVGSGQSALAVAREHEGEHAVPGPETVAPAEPEPTQRPAAGGDSQPARGAQPVSDQSELADSVDPATQEPVASSAEPGPPAPDVAPAPPQPAPVGDSLAVSELRDLDQDVARPAGDASEVAEAAVPEASQTVTSKPGGAALAGECTDQVETLAEATPAAEVGPQYDTPPDPAPDGAAWPTVPAQVGRPAEEPAEEPAQEPVQEPVQATGNEVMAAGPAPDPQGPAVVPGPRTEPEEVTAPPSAGQPPSAPAPAFPADERAAVHRLMRERRDIRNGFRPDPIPHDVLLRVLEAAHTAPSVGHSQPWDFVIIRSEETRQAVHRLAVRQRDAYAASLPKARAKQFRKLKVEAILDTPVNIVVTADPTRGGRHTLGRHSQPQLAPYSAALAVENLWLAARAEGLGVGWVSFFDERELVRALELPEHLEIVAYLCVGYVDAFPDAPELAQAGWSRRRPLAWVVHEEAYGRRALPGSEPHDLLSETLEQIRPLDAQALGEAWERQKRMTKPAGALGALEALSAQLCGLSRSCPPPVPEPAAVAVFAGDHGVHAQGVTPWPQEVTAQMVATFLAGGAVCNAFATQVGAEVCVVDVGVRADLPGTPGLVPRKVRAGTGDLTTGPAMTREEALRAVEVGIETARDLVAAGNRALLTGEMGIANTTVAAALIALFTGADPAEVTGRGTGVDDATHAGKVEVVRRGLQFHQPAAADPVGALAAVGGLEHAALAGFILGGASLRVPVILDGVSAGAAALVARALAPEAVAACVAGHRSAEPGHHAALTALGLRPLIDLDLRLGEGTGALLALPLVQSAARAMREVATFDSAGVTDKN